MRLAHNVIDRYLGQCDLSSNNLPKLRDFPRPVKLHIDFCTEKNNLAITVNELSVLQ